jgi:hypothetical protein
LLGAGRGHEARDTGRDGERRERSGAAQEGATVHGDLLELRADHSMTLDDIGIRQEGKSVTPIPTRRNSERSR